MQCMLPVHAVYIRYGDISTFVRITQLWPPTQRSWTHVIGVNVVNNSLLEFSDKTRVLSNTPKISTATFPHKRLNTGAVASNMQKTCANIAWSNESPTQHGMQ